MRLAKCLNLTNEFEVNNSVEELQRQLSKKDIDKFDIELLSHREYKIIAKLSVGIGISLTSGFSLPIYTSLKLEPKQNKTIAKLKTSLRPELIIISFLWILTIGFQLFTNHKIPIAVTLVLFPIVLVWFWFIYRAQEESLHIAIEKYLKINNN